MRALAICLALLPTLAFSQNWEGIALGPNETLLSIDGVPVQSSPFSYASPPNGDYRTVPTTPTISSSTFREPNAMYRGVPVIIGEGTAAYAHALREAQIIASRGANYHRTADGGHPLGCAPGTSYSGTGYTWDMNRPGHCWEDELPASRIVARARARGINGAWFWSAHYR